MVRTSLASAIASLSFFLAGSASAGSITVGSHMAGSEDRIWKYFTYSAEDVVTSLNESTSDVAVAGSKKLGLSDASVSARTLYLLSAGLLTQRLHWANSLMHGHEKAHFQHANRFGMTDHYFQDEETLERLSFGEAYLRTFIDGKVPGHAHSDAASPGDVDTDLYQEEGHTVAFAGINWQMNRSENWIRDSIAKDNKNVFDGSDFLINRFYMASYSYGDYKGARSHRNDGDIHKFAERLKSINGKSADENLKDTTLVSLAATLLSPAVYQAAAGYSEYAQTGDTQIDPHFVDTSLGGLTWDIPQYLNSDSLALSPTLYLNTDPTVSHLVGADNLLLSFGYETPVLGAGDPEVRMTATGSWGKVDADIGLTAADGGQFLEGSIAYNLSPKSSLMAGFSLQEGDTNRAKRNMPTGESATWVGLSFNF